MSLAWVRSAVHRSLGFEPYPGTLNVRLADPDMRSRWREVSKQRALLLTPPPPETCGGRVVSITLPPGGGAAGLGSHGPPGGDHGVGGISGGPLRGANRHEGGGRPGRS